ncbi:RNA polymerase sigma-70 factor [Parabacteroides gordonii]|jgi:RNA polymerase sigma-70 factor (ECF subfamily)|uniref:RNA polymerase sigma-70 factor n=1 Tax=Parabacteroides gordonii TaxID=574930 RepID=UPI0024203D21|nr:RNA polymerase sigma-70 factor [Parabacteroides gordonii]
MFDVALLSQLKEGNREAFNSLFRHYYPRVMAYVAAMVEQEVAEDVVQDVFLHVWENRKKLYIGEGFHSYLFQSAYTRCVDHYRKTQSTDKHKLYIENACLEECNALLKSEASVLKDIFSKDFYEQLHNLLEQLPSQRREVFILTYLDGLKAKEVSERLQIPQRTVESHIYLAIKYLRMHLSKNDFYLLSLLYFFR